MEKPTLNLLLVEDNPGDARLVQEMLRDIPGFQAHHEEQLSVSVDYLTSCPVDLVLLDLGLPDSQGLETLAAVIAAAPHVPVVVLTGNNDEEIGQRAVRQGAQDYLVKGLVDESTLSRAIRYAVERYESKLQLDHLNRVLTAIRRVDQLIVREKDPLRLIQQACNLLVDTRGYNGAWIALTGADGGPSSWARAGYRQANGAFIKGLEQGAWPGCRDKVVSAEAGLVLLDPRSSCGDCPLARQDGEDQAVVVHLRHEQLSYGVFGVAIPKHIPVDGGEQELLSEVSGDIAFALHNMALDRSRQEDAMALASANDRLRLSVKAGNVGLWDWALNSDDVYFSPEWKAQLGYAEHEFTGTFTEWESRIHPQDLKGVLEHLDAAISEPWPPYAIEFRLQHKDGSYRWILANGSMLFDEQGRPSRMLGSHVDITERRQVEQGYAASERELAMTLEATTDGIWKWDFRNNSMEFSPRYYAMLGYEPGEFPASFEAWRDQIHPDDREAAVAVAHDFLTAMPESYENWFRLRTKSGDYRMIHARAQVVERDAEGQAVRMIGNHADLTEHHEAESQIRASEARFRSYVDNAPYGIFIIDAHGQCVDVNQAAERLLGISREELLTMSLPDVLPPDREAAGRAAFDALYATGQFQGELPMLRKHGELVHVSLHAVTLGEGQYMAICSDITERRQLQAQLSQSDRLASMGMLAAGVAHEINNPLTYVLYNLHTLGEDIPRLVKAAITLQGALGAERVRELLGEETDLLSPGEICELPRWLKDASEGAGRVRDIVKELKTFTRVDEQLTAPVAINDIIETAISMAYNEIKYRARLVKEYGDLPLIMANDGKLAQVFLNLLVNAAHAIVEGDVDRNEIRVRTRVEEDVVIVEIKDTGQGIPEEHLGSIFEAFFTTKKVGVGSGLGLSICHTIITDMGGQISVESVLDRGTRFIICLPVTQEQQGEFPAEEQEPDELVRGRLLIVDDERSIGEALKRMLQEHETVYVDSGRAAQRLLEEDRAFDAIISDLMMPEVTGMDLHQWLSDHHPPLAERMLFISGGAFTPRAKKFLEEVPNPRMEKPFDPVTLRAWLREIITANRGDAKGQS